MSGGAGHIFDMIARMKSNSSLRKQRGYFNLKETFVKVSSQQGLDYKKASPEELRRVRNKIIQERKAERVKDIILIIVSSLLALIAISITIYLGMKWYG